MTASVWRRIHIPRAIADRDDTVEERARVAFILALEVVEQRTVDIEHDEIHGVPDRVAVDAIVGPR